MARCKYHNCKVEFQYQPNKKWCELHKEVRLLECAKKGILKTQQKRFEQGLYEIECKYCNKVVMSITGAKKFCSATCRSKSFVLKKRIKSCLLYTSDAADE